MYTALLRLKKWNCQFDYNYYSLILLFQLQMHCWTHHMNHYTTNYFLCAWTLSRMQKTSRQLQLLSTIYLLHTYSYRQPVYIHFCYRWVRNDHHWNVFTAYPGSSTWVYTRNWSNSSDYMHNVFIVHLYSWNNNNIFLLNWQFLFYCVEYQISLDQ